MLIFDQLKRNDPQLRLLTFVVLGGMAVLLSSLWWIQVVSARSYQENLETQSYRTVRIPAVRGEILDRNGNVLAENQPSYNVSLYLEELRVPFENAFKAEAKQIRLRLSGQLREREKLLGRKLNSKEKKAFTLDVQERNLISEQTHYQVASNVVLQVSRRLGQSLALDFTNFERHYEERLALPYPVARRLDPAQIARFEEQSTGPMGVDLEIQSLRVYPYGATAAHLLGYLQRDDRSVEGEEAFFSYRLPDYRGAIGVEAGYDTHLHGRAGEASVLVNNLGYRQAENVWTAAEPGRNVVLTIDVRMQVAAERALQVFGPTTRGAAVVMDVRTGDLLVLASSPAFDPNDFVRGFPAGGYQRMQELGAEKNRATFENYAPGSIFKPVVGLACLEAGLDPNATISNPGYIFVGRRRIHDLAAPGQYDFRRAVMFSSNTYFITNGMRAGIENILKLSRRLHLGERSGLPTRQDTPGILPSPKRIRSNWFDGDTANICIGQGEIAVTPLQMAVMTAALANGGKVLWPRLVDRIESQDPTSGEPPEILPGGRVRDELGVSPRSLQILRDAMRDEVEDAGTGARAVVPGLRICGKTGTAQVTNERNQEVDRTTWFISFAPYEKPRYAVVVMVESGNFGGTTCAPIAAKIYEAILDCERDNALKTVAQTQ